ncbi:N-acetyl-gamma-glutamyl-phosphate reductase [Kangiella sp.]|uniref:N-acetyl-gamma-glutamyl-phosphate reductase n=1 Tax=Kangiella sp. TaxID=1920245 RepID=UPI0019894427|nr:N-acetyl-gamma-glutamyl-phosphate reductase [Kangiella sp.]MBD3652785.1 N-acetyl-gamma-glutamyl-phosphate reductase [Kangiella sp.]
MSAINKYRVALVGARGYVGNELIKLLNRHPFFELELAVSRGKQGQAVEGYSKQPLVYQSADSVEVAEGQYDLIFLALPNGFAQAYVEQIELISSQSVIIDLSADYRFDDSWYYSLPELNQQIASTRISNPGCYATAMQLSLTPVVSLLEGVTHCFGVSGYSGAGTSPSDKNNPELLENNLIPYQLSEHLHEKEVSRHLAMDVKFTPHVVSFFRGISMTSHISLQQAMTEEAVIELYQSLYREHPLIKVTKAIPLVKEIQGKAGAIVGGFKLDQSGKHLVVCCVLDNLLKGAAIQALQNANQAFNLNSLEAIDYD